MCVRGETGPEIHVTWSQSYSYDTDYCVSSGCFVSPAVSGEGGLLGGPHASSFPSPALELGQHLSCDAGTHFQPVHADAFNAFSESQLLFLPGLRVKGLWRARPWPDLLPIRMQNKVFECLLTVVDAESKMCSLSFKIALLSSGRL